MDISLKLEWSVLLIQLVNFAIVYWLFSKFAAKPLIEELHKRRENVRKASEAANQYHEVMAKAEEDKKELLNEAIAHKQKLVEEASMSAKQQAERIVADADKKAASILSSAEEKAKKLSDDLESNFVDGVKQTAKVIVKKLFKKDVALQEAYVNELTDEFVASSK